MYVWLVVRTSRPSNEHIELEYNFRIIEVVVVMFIIVSIRVSSNYQHCL